MPTSSQARIIRRRASLGDIGRNAPPPIQPEDGHYGIQLWPRTGKTPVWCIPPFGLEATMPPYTDTRVGDNHRLQHRTFSSMQRSHYFHPHGLYHVYSGLNISNNVPNDDDDKKPGPEKTPTTPGDENRPERKISRKKSTKKVELVTEEGHEGAGPSKAMKGHRRSTVTATTSQDKAPGAEKMEKKRYSFAARKRSSRVDETHFPKNFVPGTTRAEQVKRESIAQSRKNVPQVHSPEDSSSGSRSRSFTFEIDLLRPKDSQSQTPSATDLHDPDDNDDIEARYKPEESAQAPKKAAYSIKGLYKQLLSIGLSANAFRGISVQTAEGEMKGATEEEAGLALEQMVTEMVGEERTGEGEEEEEEEEDVELVMGSLLCDVGNESFIDLQEVPRRHTQGSLVFGPEKRYSGAIAPAAVEPAVRAEPPPPSSPPRPSGSPPSLITATSHEEIIRPAEEGASMEEFKLDTSVDVVRRGKSEKEIAEQKALFQEVLAGATKVDKTAVAKKEATKARTELLPPKKKVMKVPPIRLRRVVPSADKDLLCIRTPNVDLTHEQVKNMLESQLGLIISLQHDPEYLQQGEVHLAPRVMWIFKMEDCTDNNYIKICLGGVVDYDGEKLRIRKRDDVVNEEFRAYQLVKQIKDEQNKRMRNKDKGKDQRAKPAPKKA